MGVGSSDGLDLGLDIGKVDQGVQLRIRLLKLVHGGLEVGDLSVFADDCGVC